jgi:hypothetical protein
MKVNDGPLRQKPDRKGGQLARPGPCLRAGF